MGTALLILGIIILSFILYKILKPYFIRHDTTLLMTGGLGSGKSLTTIKTAIILIRKQRFYKYYCYNFFKVKIANAFKKPHNAAATSWNLKHSDEIKEGTKKAKKIWQLNEKRKMPRLYSNIPVYFKTHIFGRKREWACKLKEQHILLIEDMREYSVVIIDEFPQFINQFNWKEDLIQKNVNEWITFFRHYIAGYLLLNAQSTDDIVVQVRRKLNQATWCFDFKKWGWPIPLFYTIRMCDIMLTEEVQTISTTFVEENTRLNFGLFPKKGTYDTRCYSERMKNILLPCKIERFNKIKTNKILRLQDYISPLDDKTTIEEKQRMKERADKLCNH